MKQSCFHVCPLELITDILPRLPVKPLLRFRCVSKSWFAEIDGLDFVKSHVRRPIEITTNHHLILSEADVADVYNRTYYPPTRMFSANIDKGLGQPLKALSNPLKSMKRVTEILGSCNALLLLRNKGQDLVLWNPFTRRHKTIPTEPIDTYTALENRGSPKYGFGYDSIHNDYKVVRVIECFSKDSGCTVAYEIKVYSLTMNSWRRVQDFPCPKAYILDQPGRLACGASHWLMYLYDTYADDIIAFDFGKEEFQMLPLASFTEVFDHNCLAVLQGCLCVYSVLATIQVTLYLMKPYGVKNEDWTKVLTFMQDAIPRDFFEYVRPLMYSKSGDKLLFEETFQRFLWYDLEDKKGFEIEIGNKPPAFVIEVCLESLVMLGENDSFDGHNESNSDDESNCDDESNGDDESHD
ncbi:S haplotype-specific F-box protein 1 [Tripterygium wilfordii]|uniref:S haplotype-specific F-box protein 1 n=1 Tax=Tripterygium wilfordii TaxID=458696 RepID=A0A7J7C414_TRIWF|nr:F-box protein CPR1-like [Tripterygium wilfordii]KAF5728863.1 S haplotype-specific F-box protein 1 [Tripterygium wilfordii]